LKEDREELRGSKVWGEKREERGRENQQWKTGGKHEFALVAGENQVKLTTDLPRVREKVARQGSRGGQDNGGIEPWEVKVTPWHRVFTPTIPCFKLVWQSIAGVWGVGERRGETPKPASEIRTRRRKNENMGEKEARRRSWRRYADLSRKRKVGVGQSRRPEYKRQGCRHSIALKEKIRTKRSCSAKKAKRL